MKKIIQEIAEEVSKGQTYSVIEVNGLGSVNRIFEVKVSDKEYIVRLNTSPEKKLGISKEKWCIENVAKLGIPSPVILKLGTREDTFFMIQEKINGVNGTYCNLKERELIWKILGSYVSKYNQIARIENEEIEENEFHKDWKSKLIYNLKELNEKDSLLTNKTLNQEQQNKAKQALASLEDSVFKVGLVHGDLCPRNVIWNEGKVYLLDWGTSEINVIPHNEIGILLMSNEASEKEFHFFLEGLGVSLSKYNEMKNEIAILNLLHRLDKYRWAEEYDIENIKDYAEKVKATLNNLN